MARVKFFVNDTQRALISSEVSKQGERGVDQSKFVVPPNVNINSNDTVEYVQDIVNTKHLKALWTFDHLIGDESGNGNHSVGFANIPSVVSNWKFDCSLVDSGLKNNNLILCCCGTAVYCTGKIGSKSFKFNGSTALFAGSCAECNYDAEFYQKFSLATWVKFSSVACDQALIVKSNDLTTAGGYKLYLCSSNSRLNMTFADGSCSFTINTTDCGISTCTWYHIAFTYDGSSNENGMKLYLNGECDTNNKACSAISCSIRNNVCLTLGAESDEGNKALCGTQLDDVHIFVNKQLTENQVVRLYHQGSLSYDTGKWGDAVTFDGCTSHIKIPDSSCFDLCGAFEAVWWLKAPTSCSVRTVFNKTDCCNTFDFKINACCKGVLRFGCTTLTSCTSIADCTWNQIRIRRDACCTLSMFVNNSSEATACCVSCDETNSACFTFGRNECKGEVYNGSLDSFRWYNGGVLTPCDITTLYTKSNPVITMTFGGKVTKVEKEISRKTAVAHSHGKTLSEVEVEPTQYLCKSPEFIIQDLVINNTGLKVTTTEINSGIVIGKYLADGKLFDLLDDLVSLIGATFRTHGLEVFHLEKKSFKLKTNTFTHGGNTRIWETKFDDTELVNELIVLGENKRYQEQQLASGDACQTIFSLNEAAVSIRVETPVGTEKTPEVHYTLDTLGKLVTFTSAPACGSCNILFDYEYEIPLYLKGRKQSSIDSFGVHSKRLVLPWIREKEDGVRFISGYLNRYSTIRKNLVIEHPTLVTSLRENDVVNVVNSIKGINTTFVIKSMKFEYPKFTTTIEVGEYTFDDFEYDKQVAQKIHDLENAVSTIRDLRGYRGPEEVLGLTDTVNVNVNIEALECLSITDATCVTEIFDAVYDCACTIYDGNDAYV